MDNNKFSNLISRLTQLSNNYQNGSLKHMSYVVEYDKVLESCGVTKKELVQEIERRKNGRNDTDSPHQQKPKTPFKKKPSPIL